MPKRKEETPTSSLHLTTLDLLKSSEETTFEIAVATGLGYSWLAAFRGNRMPDPSVRRVQKLYEHLIGKPLKLGR
jgi:hypothetical protein